jgi:hypothetical protein
MDNENQLHLLQEMLNKAGNNDPVIQQLPGQQNVPEPKKGKQKEISKEVIRCLRIQNKKLLEQVESLKNKLKSGHADTTQITNKLSYLTRLNNELSEALGSCDKCWGDDQGCMNCYGKGSPGWRPVNKRLFYLYVLPTLERLYGMNR